MTTDTQNFEVNSPECPLGQKAAAFPSKSDDLWTALDEQISMLATASAQARAIFSVLAETAERIDARAQEMAERLDAIEKENIARAARMEERRRARMERREAEAAEPPAPHDRAKPGVEWLRLVKSDTWPDGRQ